MRATYANDFGLEALEPRLLLSADPVGELAASAFDFDDQRPAILEPLAEETEDTQSDDLFGDLDAAPVLELPDVDDDAESAAEEAPSLEAGPAAPLDALPPVAESAPAADRADETTAALVTTLHAANPPPVGGPRSSATSGDEAMGGRPRTRDVRGSMAQASPFGVISDSFDVINSGVNAAADQTAGDLGAVTVLSEGRVRHGRGAGDVAVDL